MVILWLLTATEKKIWSMNQRIECAKCNCGCLLWMCVCVIFEIISLWKTEQELRHAITNHSIPRDWLMFCNCEHCPVLQGVSRLIPINICEEGTV